MDIRVKQVSNVERRAHLKKGIFFNITKLVVKIILCMLKHYSLICNVLSGSVFKIKKILHDF